MDGLFIVDAHEDIAFHISYFDRDFENPEVPCMITLPWLQQAGVRLVFNTIFVHPKHRPHKTSQKAKEQIEIYNQIYKKYENNIVSILNSDDLDKLEKNSKIGFLTLMEGADPIEDLRELEFYYSCGLRILGPSWNNKNKFASGPETELGLTKDGTKLIEKMNDLGITLDLSHLNEKSFWSAIELTKFVPIATHSNARALTNHPRNLKDEQLLAISKRGGVIGIVFYNSFLKTKNNPPTLEDIYEHTNYIVNLCGEDHVGIGTDLDGGKIQEFPEEVRQISKLPLVAEYFLNKGYSIERVKKIMGGNFLRVIKKNLSNQGYKK
ncbi:MAG: dipeptidase [Thermodesulfobacteriota bacterium]